MSKQNKNISWRGWFWKINHINVAVAAVVIIIVVAQFFSINNRISKEMAVEKGRALGALIAALNRDALVHNRPEEAMLKQAMKHEHVRDAVVFDLNGDIFAPVSMYGKGGANRRIVEDVISRGRATSRTNSDGRTEIFMPIFEDAESSRIVRGVAYILLDRFIAISAGNIILVSAVLLCGIAAILLLFKKEISGKIKDIKRVHNLSSKETIRLFEAERRKIIHALRFPVIVLDSDLRLVEMNQAAVRHFNCKEDIAGGRHVVDVLKGENCGRRVIDELGRLPAKDDSLTCFVEDDTAISMFSSTIDQNGFKYTIIFSGRGVE